MNHFNVLTLGEFISGEESAIAIRAFAEFFHSITSKHQKKSNLILIEDIDFCKQTEEKLRRSDLMPGASIVQLHHQQEVENRYKSASVFLLPTFKKVSPVLTEALSFGLPILCFDHPKFSEHVDVTCGMMVQHKSHAQSIQEFGRMLHMLYFDPAARQILKKGALQKYQKDFSWGSNVREAV